jgi:ribosome maturation factor RimP
LVGKTPASDSNRSAADQGRHAALIAELCEIVSDVVSEFGLELVELRLRGSGKRRLLRLDIDRAGLRGVDLDDCQRVSAAVGERLEGTDLLQDGYLLEVSSPGIDRPIRSADDIRRNTGRKVVVATTEPIDGRRLVRGTLQGVAGGAMRVVTEDETEVRIPLDRIESARQDVGF